MTGLMAHAGSPAMVRCDLKEWIWEESWVLVTTVTVSKGEMEDLNGSLFMTHGRRTL